MEIFKYLGILIGSLCGAGGLGIILDEYFTVKKYKVRKRWIIMFKSKYGDKKHISSVSFRFQISSYVYNLAVLTLAIIELFVWKSETIVFVFLLLSFINFVLTMSSIAIFNVLMLLDDDFQRKNS